MPTQAQDKTRVSELCWISCERLEAQKSWFKTHQKVINQFTNDFRIGTSGFTPRVPCLRRASDSNRTGEPFDQGKISGETGTIRILPEQISLAPSSKTGLMHKFLKGLQPIQTAEVPIYI
jgi:hypothetical protein